MTGEEKTSVSDEFQMTVRRFNSTLEAAAAILIYAVMVGYIDNYVRIIASESGLWQFQVMRSAMALAIVAGLLALPMVPRLRMRAPKKILLRAVIQCAAMFIYFGSLGFLSVAQAAAGLFTAPIFVLLIGRLAYGHRLGLLKILAALSGFAGVVMVLSPDPASLGLATLVPVLGGALYAYSSVLTREWCQGESPLTLTVTYMAMMGAMGLVVLLCLWAFGPEAPEGAAGYLIRGPVAVSGEVLFWTAMQALGSLAGVALMLHAYQQAEASRVAVFEYVLLPVSALWAWVIWGETIGPVALLGMGLIILAGIAMSWRAGRG